MTTYTDGEVADIVRGTVLATLTGVVFPAGAMGRVGAQFDRANALRAAYHPDSVPLPTHASEERILRGYVAVIQSLWDVHAQIDISLTQAPPTLGVLMERDVVWGALGIASEQCTEAAVEFAKVYEDDEPKTRDESPLAGLLAAMSGGGGVSNPAREAVKEILGELKAIPDAGAKVTYEPLRNNPWYITVIGSLARSLGAEIDLPSDSALPERVSGWRP